MTGTRVVSAWAAAFGLLVACGSATDLLTTPEPAGSASGSGSGSGSGSNPITACAALEQCCLALPASAQSGCATVIASNDETICNQVLTEATNAGLCVPTSGFGSGSGQLITGFCGTLFGCCMTLPPASVPPCNQVASSNDQPICQTQLAQLQAAGACVGH